MSTQVMTRADLFDWVKAHGCDIIPLEEYKAKVIKVVNRKNGNEAYINLPIDDRPVFDFTVCKVCSKLSIPIPRHVEYVKPFHDRLEKEHDE